MTIDIRLSRRAVIVAGATLPWLGLPADAPPAAPAIDLGLLPAYADEAATALQTLTPTEQAILDSLASRCLAALPADDPPAAVAALDILAREDFIAGRTPFAAGWLISLSEAAVFFRLGQRQNETAAPEGSG